MVMVCILLWIWITVEVLKVPYLKYIVYKLSCKANQINYLACLDAFRNMSPKDRRIFKKIYIYMIFLGIANITFTQNSDIKSGQKVAKFTRSFKINAYMINVWNTLLNYFMHNKKIIQTANSWLFLHWTRYF